MVPKHIKWLVALVVGVAALLFGIWGKYTGYSLEELPHVRETIRVKHAGPFRPLIRHTGYLILHVNLRADDDIMASTDKLRLYSCGGGSDPLIY